MDRAILGVPPKTPYVGHVDDGVGAIITNTLMLQDNWLAQVFDRIFETDLSRRSLGTAAPWWTVAIEWWIYIAFGCAVALLLGKTRHRMIAWVAMAFALFSTVSLTLAGSALVLSWVAGALVGWSDPKASRVAWRAIFGVSAAIVVLSLSLRPDGVYTIPVAVGTAVGIYALYRSYTWDSLRRVAPVIQFTANYSYSLYLIHFSLLVWLSAVWPERGWAFVVGGFLISNLCAIAWWYLFERHFVWVRSKLGR